MRHRLKDLESNSDAAGSDIQNRTGQVKGGARCPINATIKQIRRFHRKVRGTVKDSEILIVGTAIEKSGVY